MRLPTVSVLMTAYNRRAFIAEAIESVLAQTFEDFELIVVDDASADGTLAAAKTSTRDPRVRLVCNERNLGDYPNRNRAAGLARGRYLKYVDADDAILPDCLAVMVGAMERHPTAALGLCKAVDGRWELPAILSPREACREHFLHRSLLHNAPLSAIVRTEAFRAAGGFSPMRYVGDVDLWLRLAARWPVVLIRGGLTWWRSHDQQESRRERADARAAGLRHAVALAALHDAVCPLTATERGEAIRRIKRRAARDVLRTLLTAGPRRAIRLLASAGLCWHELARAFTAETPRHTPRLSRGVSS